MLNQHSMHACSIVHTENIYHTDREDSRQLLCVPGPAAAPPSVRGAAVAAVRCGLPEGARVSNRGVSSASGAHCGKAWNCTGLKGARPRLAGVTPVATAVALLAEFVLTATWDPRSILGAPGRGVTLGRSACQTALFGAGGCLYC